MTTIAVGAGQHSSGLVANNGDQIQVLNGGMVVVDVIEAGGLQIVAAGGSAQQTAVEGGSEQVQTGGTENTGAVTNGGNLDNFGLAKLEILVDSVMEVEAGGSSLGSDAQTGGTIILEAGAEGTNDLINGASAEEVIQSGGSELTGFAGGGGYIYAQGGGTAMGGSALSGGNVVAEAGGTLSNTTVIASGAAIVQNGGLEINTVVGGSNATDEIQAGGFGISGTINNLGENIVAGETTSETVNSGGVQLVQGGGTANLSDIEAGGLGIVDVGGTMSISGTTGTGEISLQGTSGITANTSQLSLLVVSGTTSPSNVVANFGQGDGIDFASVAYMGGEVSGSLNGSGSTTISGITISETANTLTVTSGGVTQTADVTGVGNFGYTLFDDNGTLLFEVCFAEGTMIATPDGETAVERLTVGDLVQTRDGAKPVKWIGYRSVDVRKLADPDMGRLIRIRRGACGDTVPHTDLLITPEHSLYVDGVLIPVRLLLNGGSIVRDELIDRYTYYHVELEQHGILIANGLTTESYLDTGNRKQFQNAAVTGLRQFGFDSEINVASWDEDAAAPMAVDAERVKPVWDRLAARSEAIGYPLLSVATDDEPELALVIGTHRIEPVIPQDGWARKLRYLFPLPEGLAGATAPLVGRLISKTAVPAELEPWRDDRRRLGVKVEHLVLFHTAGGIPDVIDLRDPALSDGWWDAEMLLGWASRWTRGDAAIPIMPGTRALEVMVCNIPAYPIALPQEAPRSLRA